MNKIFSFAFAAAALFAAVSCQKEINNDNHLSKAEDFTITVSYGADTKTTLVDGKKTYWTSDDKITVFDAEQNNRCFEFVSSEDGGKTATFSTPEFIMPASGPLFALYPYSEDLALEYNTSDPENVVFVFKNLNIPATQTAKADSFDPAATIAVGASLNSESVDLSFVNLYSLFKFVVKGNDVQSIKVKANGETDQLVGKSDVQLGTSVVYDKKDASSEVTLAGTFEDGKTYYIAVYPGTYASGFTVYVNDEEVKTTSESKTLEMNKIYNLGELECESVGPKYVETIYLQPGLWDADNAWYAVHFFNSAEGAEDVAMTDEDKDGVYEVDVPAGMESVIFCRMNPESEVFGWESVWNQTGDLAIPLANDPKVYYNVTDWKAGEWSDTPQESTPEVVEKEWGIVGTMTSWSDNISMTLVDGWYVAENVTIKTSDEFKFRVGTSWDELKTYNATAIVADTEYETVDGQGEGNGMKVAVSAIYSVYLSSDATTMKVVKTGDLPAVENWDVCGTFTGNWDVTASLAMTALGDGWYVLENVEIYKDDEFKFVIDKGWSNSLGAEGAVLTAETGKEYALTSSDSQNIKVNKNGRFTISLNPTDKKFKVECVEEYSDLTVNITIDNNANWSPLYIYLESDGTALTPAEGALVSNTTYAVSGDYIGSTLTCKFLSGSKVSEIMNVAITKNGATVTLEETVIKLKVQLDTDNSKQWWGNTMKIHVWNTGTSFDTSWPGNTMTSEGNYTWSIIVPSELVGKTINYLVHNGNGWQSSNATVTISASGNTVTGSSIGIN